MSKFLVTGGAGFIGSHLVEFLIAKGHDVLVLDDFSTGLRAHVPSSASLLVGDVTNPSTVKTCFKKIDGCFHLAAIASVAMSNEEWSLTHKVNSSGTVNVFAAAKQLKVPVVYASSAAVYGNSLNKQLSETCEPNPQSAYGVDKFFCELTGRIASNIHKIPNVGIRFFNVYGPRQNAISPYTGVVSLFSHRIINHKFISIFGDGTQCRDFLYVADAVLILWASMEKMMKGSLEGSNILNACTSIPTTINSLANSIESALGIHVERLFCPPRPGDIHSSVGDPSLALSKLGIQNFWRLEDGLKPLLNFLSQENNLRIYEERSAVQTLLSLCCS